MFGFDWRKSLAAGMAALSMTAVQAAYIVETGPGASGSTMVVLGSQGISYQHLGVSFSVGQDSSITSVEGWIDADAPGNVDSGDGQGLSNGTRTRAAALSTRSTYTTARDPRFDEKDQAHLLVGMS